MTNLSKALAEVQGGLLCRRLSAADSDMSTATEERRVRCLLRGARRRPLAVLGHRVRILPIQSGPETVGLN
jgi:hypothetical protein